MSMPAVIESLSHILKKSVYEVPKYQRNYAWEEPQLQDLWEDLEAIDPHKGPAHFTGTIVVEKRESLTKYAKTYTRYKIVDGQQRLATLTILLFCIYERLMRFSRKTVEIKKTARNIMNEYVKDEGTGVYMLKLNGSDDAFLKDVILRVTVAETVAKHPQTRSELRLRNAKNFFRKKLSEKSPKYLTDLLNKTLNWLQFIRYEVGQEVEAGLLFEAMNDRGKPITQVDKIKNYLVYVAYKKQDEQLANFVNEAWGEIYRNLSEAEDKGFEEDDLLRYHWITYSDAHETYSDVHRQLKQLINLKNEGVLKSAKNYVDSLKETSYVFREIISPSNKNNFKDWQKSVHINTIKEHLESLHRLRTIAVFLPLLIASRITFKSSPEVFAEIAKLCELYAMRIFKIANRRADIGKYTLYSLAHEVFNARTLDELPKREIYDKVVSEFRSFIEDYCDDKELERNLSRSDLFPGWLEEYEVKYLLYEYERKKRKEHKEPPPSWDEVEKDITIEHILPETPERSEQWSKGKRKTHRECVNRLGNLTLATREWNSTLGNKFFLKKKRQYKKSTLLVQRELTEYNEWWKNQIEKRTRKLIDFAINRWGLA